jgi:hypothetical protein
LRRLVHGGVGGSERRGNFQTETLHKRLHTRNQDDSWSARKRIPAEVQEAYAKLYGVRWASAYGRGAASRGSRPELPPDGPFASMMSD